MHSPNFIMHPYIGALLFGVSPIRCACIIKYGAVLKFFQQPFWIGCHFEEFRSQVAIRKKKSRPGKLCEIEVVNSSNVEVLWHTLRAYFRRSYPGLTLPVWFFQNSQNTARRHFWANWTGKKAMCQALFVLTEMSRCREITRYASYVVSQRLSRPRVVQTKFFASQSHPE